MARYCAGTANSHPRGSGMDQMVSFSFPEAQQIPHHGGRKPNRDFRRQQAQKNVFEKARRFPSDCRVMNTLPVGLCTHLSIHFCDIHKHNYSVCDSGAVITGLPT